VFPTLSDLEGELGRSITDAEAPKARRALRVAINRARALTLWVDWDVTDFPAYASDVVTALAARRFLARTDGLVAVGPFRYSDTQASLDFTASELAVLSSAGGVTGGSYTVSIATPDP
jgi:hypothetical protein